MIVVDASAAVSALLHADQARALLPREQIHVPHLADIEIASGLRRLARAGVVTVPQAWSALSTWRRLAVSRHPASALLERIWELRDNLSANDASYVALAERLGCHLLTADARLSRSSGLRCPITVVPG